MELDEKYTCIKHVLFQCVLGEFSICCTNTNCLLYTADVWSFLMSSSSLKKTHWLTLVKGNLNVCANDLTNWLWNWIDGGNESNKPSSLGNFTFGLLFFSRRKKIRAEKLPKILTSLSHKWLSVSIVVSHKSIPQRWELLRQTEGTGSVQGTALAGVSREKEMGKGKQANWFQKHSMKKTLLLQIGFRKSTQCICWDYWPGENSTELPQLANNHWVQKSSVLRINHLTDTTLKKILGRKQVSRNQKDRDVTADTFQSTWEQCCVPDARTAHLHPLLQMSAPGSAALPGYTFQPQYLSKEKQIATKFRFPQHIAWV